MGGSPACPNGTPCGGDVVGTWTVNTSCLAITGTLNLGSLGVGCSSASITAGSLQVTGKWTAAADGTFTDETTTTGSEQFTLAPACLTVSGTTTTCERITSSIGPTLGFASAICTADAVGGCSCSATVDQTAWMGIVNLGAPSSGSYTISGNTLSVNDGLKDWPYAYCVSNGTLTLTPQTTTPTTTGTIVLKK